MYYEASHDFPRLAGLSNPVGMAVASPLLKSFVVKWGGRILATITGISVAKELVEFVNSNELFNDTVSIITERANFNACQQSKQLTSCNVYAPEIYKPEQVKTILSVYIALMNDPYYANLPEYDRTNPASAQTLQAIAKLSGHTENIVRVVMFELFNATNDNTIRSTEFLKPRTAREAAKFRQTPEQYKNEDKSFLDSFNNVLGDAKMLVYVGAGVAALFLLYQLAKD